MGKVERRIPEKQLRLGFVCHSHEPDGLGLALAPRPVAPVQTRSVERIETSGGAVDLGVD